MASSPVALIAGLGNPGPGHRDDRHNVGFWAVDALCRQEGVALREETRFKGCVGRAAAGYRVLKPMTWMNASGESVAACAAYWRIAPDAIIVVHDDLDLSVGTVRLKCGGGHGGHNGLRSVEQMLGSRNFVRVRIGIGHPGPGRDVSGYVLSKPPAADHEAIGRAIEAVLAELDVILAGNFSRAMNTLNRRDDG